MKKTMIKVWIGIQASAMAIFVTAVHIFEFIKLAILLIIDDIGEIVGKTFGFLFIILLVFCCVDPSAGSFQDRAFIVFGAFVVTVIGMKLSSFAVGLAEVIPEFVAEILDCSDLVESANEKIRRLAYEYDDLRAEKGALDYLFLWPCCFIRLAMNTIRIFGKCILVALYPLSGATAGFGLYTLFFTSGIDIGSGTTEWYLAWALLILSAGVAIWFAHEFRQSILVACEFADFGNLEKTLMAVTRRKEK